LVVLSYRTIESLVRQLSQPPLFIFESGEYQLYQSIINKRHMFLFFFSVKRWYVSHLTRFGWR